jgi:hypothetical protein
MHTEFESLALLKNLDTAGSAFAERLVGDGSYLTAPLARIYDVVLVQRRLWVGPRRLHCPSIQGSVISCRESKPRSRNEEPW